MECMPCRSYLSGNGIYGPCKDGFPQNGVCMGISIEHIAPFCCNEERCGWLYDDFGGKPPEHMLTPNVAGERLANTKLTEDNEP